MNTLQQGHWVGKGADKFYGAMNSAVLPAMKRLVNALQSAAQTTNKLSSIMKRADIAEVQRRRQDHYNDMSPANEQLADNGVYTLPNP